MLIEYSREILEAGRKRVLSDLAPRRCPEVRDALQGNTSTIVSDLGIGHPEGSSEPQILFKCPGRNEEACRKCKLKTEPGYHKIINMNLG